MPDRWTSDLIQKPVAELASHGLFVVGTQEALPALPNQNDEAAVMQRISEIRSLAAKWVLPGDLEGVGAAEGDVGKVGK